ncbi:MAG: DoxX family protein [Pirellulales bacterium]
MNNPYAQNDTPSSPKWMRVTGWVFSLLPMPMLAMSICFKLMPPKEVLEGFKKMGFPDGAITGIGIVELCITVLYLIPQTAVLGAILLTGYLGGAVVTHLRVGEPYWAPIVMGVVLWLGLYFRDARVRALAPIRSI